MMTGLVHDQNLEKHIEKQMGCMTGFLQIFDRHQILTGKRLCSAKRLPPATPVDSTPESEKSVGSPVVTREFEKPQPRTITSPSPDRYRQFPVTEPRSPLPDVASPASKLPLPLPIFEYKEGARSPWKFNKEAPRLSLDSRAVADAKGTLYPREIRTNAAMLSTAHRSGDESTISEDSGVDNQRRSTSVIARLMGLEPLPPASPEPTKKAELRRSASESRVSRDLFHSRFVDGNSFQQNQPNQSSNARRDNAGVETIRTSTGRLAERMEYRPSRKARSEPPPKASQSGVRGPPWKLPQQQRRSYYDTEDFFPEPKQTGSIYGEIEKRLKMRGIDEPTKDLETLKQILEALQLKGLLHSKKPSEEIRRRNFVYDKNFSDESPIVVMKPASLTSVSPTNRRNGNESPRSRVGGRRNLNSSPENLPTVSPRRERSPARSKNSSSPNRNESNAKPSNSLIKRKPLSVEVQRKAGNETVEQQRRGSPVHSPNLKRYGSDQTVTNRSPRNKKPTAQIKPKEKIEDESSSISESSFSTSSQTDTTTERSKMEEYKEGRNLLERCDKLLHSIAEITSATTTELQQPSPVSVLDSSFYKDESSSSTPSPVMKRSIEFKDQLGDEDEDIWSSEICALQSKSEDRTEDSDFAYVSEIFRASQYLPEDSDIFQLLEKQQYLKGKDTSKVSRLERKLTFDTITEILDRNRQLPPWKKTFSCSNFSDAHSSSSFRELWSEFQRIRERDAAEDLFEIICGVLKKDLAGDVINGWGEYPVEFAEAVLDIERLIFKDLVGEALRDLAAFAGKGIVLAAPSRRKLAF